MDRPNRALIASLLCALVLACGIKAPPKPSRPPPPKAQPAAPVQPLPEKSPESQGALDAGVPPAAADAGPDAGA